MTLTSDVDCPRGACIGTSRMYFTVRLEKIVIGALEARHAIRTGGVWIDTGIPVLVNP